MAPKYTYIITDIKTGTVREEIPFSSIQYTRSLNEAGGFTATGPLYNSENPNSGGFNKMSSTVIEPGKTELWVLRNNVVLYGGIIWGVSGDVDQRTLVVTGKDHYSYLGRRALDKTHKFTGTDQFTIVKTLVDYMQTATSGDIGLTVPSATSGVTRDREIFSSEYRAYSDIVKEMANLDDGYDFAVDFGGTVQGGFTKQLTLSNRRGRSTDLQFEIGKNIELNGYTEDAFVMANRVTAVGSGEGSEQITGVAANANSLNTYPLLETVAPFKAIDNTTVIVAKAKAVLKNFDEPVKNLRVRIVNSLDPDSRLGSYLAGDDVRVFGRRGYIRVDDQFRIMSFDVTINQAGKETVNVVLTQLEGTV